MHLGGGGPINSLERWPIRDSREKNFPLRQNFQGVWQAHSSSQSNCEFTGVPQAGTLLAFWSHWLIFDVVET